MQQKDTAQGYFHNVLLCIRSFIAFRSLRNLLIFFVLNSQKLLVISWYVAFLLALFSVPSRSKRCISVPTYIFAENNHFLFIRAGIFTFLLTFPFPSDLSRSCLRLTFATFQRAFFTSIKWAEKPTVSNVSRHQRYCYYCSYCCCCCGRLHSQVINNIRKVVRTRLYTLQTQTWNSNKILIHFKKIHNRRFN